MAKRSLSPEVKIMNLFLTLNDDGRRIVGDWIKSQTATPRKATVPKSPAPSAGRKSSPKPGGAASTASTEGGAENVGTASGPPGYAPKCAVCGNVESHADHSPESRDFHIFRTSIKQKPKVNGEDKVQGATA